MRGRNLSLDAPFGAPPRALFPRFPSHARASPAAPISFTIRFRLCASAARYTCTRAPSIPKYRILGIPHQRFIEQNAASTLARTFDHAALSFFSRLVSGRFRFALKRILAATPRAFNARRLALDAYALSA